MATVAGFHCTASVLAKWSACGRYPIGLWSECRQCLSSNKVVVMWSVKCSVCGQYCSVLYVVGMWLACDQYVVCNVVGKVSVTRSVCGRTCRP